MKTILTTLFLLSNLLLISQDWCHQGSQWTYTIVNQLGYYGYLTYTYQLDTIIASQSCKKLTAISVIKSELPPFPVGISYPNPIYTYEKNDTVFFYNQFRAIFNPSYFFSANVGDTVNYRDLEASCDDTIIHYLIINKGVLNISGQNLKYYDTKAINIIENSFRPDSIRVIERMGCTQAIVPFHQCGTDGEGRFLRCYQDDSFAVYQTSAEIYCDYLTNINDKGNLEKLTLSPNPANSFIYLNNKESVHFEIKNILGQIVLKNKLDSNQPINISTLPTGLFFIQIEEFLPPRITTIKFLKN